MLLLLLLNELLLVLRAMLRLRHRILDAVRLQRELAGLRRVELRRRAGVRLCLRGGDLLLLVLLRGGRRARRLRESLLLRYLELRNVLLQLWSKLLGLGLLGLR